MSVNAIMNNISWKTSQYKISLKSQLKQVQYMQWEQWEYTNLQQFNCMHKK